MSISFSIIIPLYNKERTIRKTLDSVSNIQWEDYEVVVVDDGSTDGGVKIVELYPSDKIRLVKKDNGGVSSARNYGATKAQNPWLLFLDADDLLFPNVLEVFSDLIQRYPRDEVFVGNYLSKEGSRTLSFYSKKEFISENPHRDLWLSHFYLRPGSFCCSKHVFAVSGGFDERMSFNEDFEYCMRLCSLFRVVSTPQKVMEYVTEYNEGRTKVHPIDKNYSFYLPYININNKYLRHKSYRAINSAIDNYRAINANAEANILQKIKKQKFGKAYCVIDFLMYQYLGYLRRWRTIREDGLITYLKRVFS